ncbi:type II secretion system protein [Schinkia azotoformans]|uniref:type II secretion system protein n=1 Tax=Schinkia azotoformans TaxID=1454 RepID=UPI002DB97158|nr:type II secretion system protein [Schinkia azotoformans]MEC1759138.1 type II secretion system protein [Schinkia azotoformans]
MLKRILKNEKGLTLIELLAVVVILGIIAAIAVPSIGGIIDNTRKDAHVANARQMISAAKIAIAGDSKLAPVTSTETAVFTLAYLEKNGYLETLEDPDGGNYSKGTATEGGIGKTGGDSYVEVTKPTGSEALVYKVKLTGSKRAISTLTLEKDLDRGDVSNTSGETTKP